MRESVTNLTQSQYYSPAFNGAIFDGPIRIYFAQYQEGIALQIYFGVQKFLRENYSEESNITNSRNLFIMLYPSSETYERSFEQEGVKEVEQKVFTEDFGDDYVLGVQGPILDVDFKSIINNIQNYINTVSENLFSPLNPLSVTEEPSL